MADWTLAPSRSSGASGDVVLVPPEPPPPELHPASPSTSGARASAHPACRFRFVAPRSTAGNLGAPVP